MTSSKRATDRSTQGWQVSTEPIARKQLEPLICECQEHYGRLVESCPDVVYRLQLRPQVRIEYINSAAERLFGYPLAALQSADLDFIQTMFANEEREDAMEVVEGRRFYSSVLRRMCRADGTMIWVEIHNRPVYDHTGAVVAQEGTIRDVSDRITALADLRLANEQLQLLTASLPELLMRLDESGTFIEQIPTASRQPAHLFLGQTMVAMIPEPVRSEANKLLADALGGRPGSLRCQVTLFGYERTYEFRLLPCGSAEPLALLRDVTDEVSAPGNVGTDPPNELAGKADPRQGIHNPYALTRRELTVLLFLARGLANKQIAYELGIVPATVNKHVSSILAKMGAGSRTEVCVRAFQEGLVSEVAAA